ncbi:Crp/Fnr family transcriptional regulator [Aliivibrio fischeri]|uniref:Crp/Fnr family transcriptional regulator n=1 Tax=Aliivibrio fischeri TaxID=668 RepID=UPI00080E3A72|nr:Crp/Fnr family transcriptional regulator [Aliivibrio fischeri]MUL10809.1 cyclic nucleotide-binding domain-containing protein [Aliivibrio fischeri]MUL12955.1 cyclic nucleotide-binding domain-containing protein [Aliivibrio fischeri]OCH08304.1 cyclic nucleotide-binding protein [Aliivibrio fischeri]OCH09261.1 cyclic nucleotide-binding protein [Aliivibrio fischeri]
MDLFQQLISELNLPKISYVKNELLLQQSTPINSLLFCQDADLTIFHINEHGKEFILGVDTNYSGPLGEMEFFQQKPYSTLNVKANKAGYLYKIPKLKLLELLREKPELTILLLEFISTRYNKNITKLMNNITLSARINVIEQILELKQHSNSPLFKIPVTLKAKQLGITDRCYRQILQVLEKENKLIKQGHEFELLDEKALKDEVLYTEVDR